MVGGNGHDHGRNLLPLIDRPDRVAIVALGFSSQSFVQEQIALGSTGKKAFDEVWTVNRGINTFRHDKLFVMDDFKWLEQRDPGYAAFLKNHDKPVFTSTVYGDYPSAVEYPLPQVVESIGDDCFCVNTVAYMLAYAIHIGVKEVSIYGADFFYPNGNQSERGGQAVAYLLGVCQERKIFYRIPQTSTLLYSNGVKIVGGQAKRTYYGYHRKDELNHVAQNARNTPVRAGQEHGQGAPRQAESGPDHQAPAH
jgi:hypothetical protein